MTTKTKAPVAVQAADAAAVDAVLTTGKPTAHDRLQDVLGQIGKHTVKDLEPGDVKWGKAIALQGGGSVYINRSNADVRAKQAEVSAWVKALLGTARGPQNQYLRISF